MTRLILSYCALLFALATQAQSIEPSVVNASGGWIQNATVLVEWSLGEPAITTISNAENIVTQGFIQPHLEISGVDGLIPGEEITVYPNPARDHLLFKTNSTRIASLTVYDLLGRVVLENAFVSDLDIHQLPGGVYFVSLLDAKSRLLTTFKIIKI